MWVKYEAYLKVPDDMQFGDKFFEGIVHGTVGRWSAGNG